MKTKLFLVLILSALGAARGASTPTATEMAAPVAVAFADDSAGLLGHTYSGLEFGYTHHVESAPRSLRRVGFVSNRPLAEARNVDAAFRYNYTRGTGGGASQSQHDGAVSFVGYLPGPETRPFLRGDLGWAWSRGAGNSENAFRFLVGAGVELRLTPRAVLTPFINYQDAPDMDERAVWFGAQTSYRFDRTWSGTFAVQMDDKHNIEYTVGVVRRF